MRYFRHFLGPALLSILLTAGAAPQAHRDGTRTQMEAAFHDGKTVVLVVAPAPAKDTDSDETYGDWADGLNRFAAHAGSNVRILKLTLAKLSLLTEEPAVKGPYATLFLRNSERALVYDGIVSEPRVYEIGLAYLKGHLEEKSASTYGLQEESVRFR